MSNVAIYQISLAQNINFNSKRGFKDTKNYKKCLKLLISKMILQTILLYSAISTFSFL